MRLYCLSANQPITKKYAKVRKNTVKTPYPFVYEVTSHEYDVDSIESFYNVVVAHAEQGHCLLKGELSRPLVQESRAGATISTTRTEWVCLDLDGVDRYASVDAFLHAIDCGDTDYILQWSASQGIDGSDTLRCHIFMLLDEPATPQYLKRWLTTINLTNTVLREQLQLTRTNCSLRWVLDITTCQNDKLLYIAPPQFKNMEDPLEGKPRIELVCRKRRRLSIQTKVLESAAIRDQSDKRVNELRAVGLMPPRKTKYKIHNDVEYATAPDRSEVTDIKVERGFVYLNINGGDSWAYYHPEDNPMFIYNFKGEPVYRTQELLPSYWIKVSKKKLQTDPGEDGVVYLAFRDFRTSNYYNGWYDKGTDNLTLAMAKSEKQLKDFLKQHDCVVPDFVPDWTLAYDPLNTEKVDMKNKTINTFQLSEVMQNDPVKTDEIPPVCHKIIWHVLGEDTSTYNHFINWLACVVQFRDRTGTAWIMRGCQGTGKGLLFHNILTPLLGAENTVAKRMEELESEFTGFFENKLLTSIDEIEVGSSVFHAKITAKLKNLIVEPYISIRKMYTPAYMARNYNNMIFSSNKPNAVHVSPDDRRYNVSPYQENKLVISAQEIEDLLPRELKQLYGFLAHYPANRDTARLPLVNAARDTLIDINMTAIDSVCNALLTGDFAFFWDLLPARKPDDTGALPPNFFRYERYRAVLIRILNDDEGRILTRDDLHTIFDWCDSSTPSSPNKFTALLKHHKIHIKPVWVNQRSVRGIEVDWTYESENWVNDRKQEIEKGVV